MGRSKFPVFRRNLQHATRPPRPAPLSDTIFPRPNSIEFMPAGEILDRIQGAARRLVEDQFNQSVNRQWSVGGNERAFQMRDPVYSQFKATALSEDTLRSQAPSIFAEGPMFGVSRRYTFVPTAQIVEGLRKQDWVPVTVEEQHIRNEARRGFQKHLIRFRRAEQMQTLDEWNVELVLLNSHDAGCAYQLHAGIFRRVCSNGLVLSEGSFQAVRFRHSGLESEVVVEASFRVLESMPRVGEMIHRFSARFLDARESLLLATHALRLRYEGQGEPPVEPETLLKARRPEDERTDLWTTLNRLQENLIRGGASDFHRDRRGKLRSVRTLRGIDSRVSLNKAIWSLAERVANGETLPPADSLAFTA